MKETLRLWKTAENKGLRAGRTMEDVFLLEQLGGEARNSNQQVRAIPPGEEEKKRAMCGPRKMPSSARNKGE